MTDIDDVFNEFGQDSFALAAEILRLRGPVFEQSPEEESAQLAIYSAYLAAKVFIDQVACASQHLDRLRGRGSIVVPNPGAAEDERGRRDFRALRASELRAIVSLHEACGAAIEVLEELKGRE